VNNHPRDRIQQSAPISLFCAAPMTGWCSSSIINIRSGAAVTVIPTSCEPHHLRLALRSHRLKQAIYPDHLHRRGGASTCGAGRFSRFLLACASSLTENG